MAEMTLNEAIEHAKEVAEESCSDCAKEHAQLARWLEELLEFRRVALMPSDLRPVVYSYWIKNDNGTYSCERCNSWIPEEQRYYANWCLYCGAYMSGDDADG